MNRLRILQIIFFVITFSITIFVQKTNVYGYSCLPDRYCADTGNPSGMDGFLWGWKWVFDNCYSNNWPFNCTGTDDNCSGGISLYSTHELCIAGGETDLYWGCCNLNTSCPDPDCDPTPTCPGDTTTTNTGDLYSTVTEDCATGDPPCPENTETISCYCKLCDINAVSCDDLDEVNQGWGSYPEYRSCENTPVGVNCDTRPKTCFCYEPADPPLCPSTLLDTKEVDIPNMILEDFTSSHNKCNVYKYHDCFEPVSPQPTESLIIIPDDANGYNFISDTHTGVPLGGRVGNLNDPINMVASYTDVNGAGDIEALGVWFRNASNTSAEVETPKWISTSAVADAPSNDSWGFMMVRESGIWVPYVPSWAPTIPVWTRAAYTNSGGVISFVISGPSRGNMVAVNITSPITSVGNIVTMPFSLRFSGTNIVENVSQTTYKILLMGLDVFSFTPYDNYPGVSMDGYWSANQLRYRTEPPVAQTYARDWASSNVSAGWYGNQWTIDKIAPGVTVDEPSVVGNTLNIKWSATDDKSLYAIVGNIYSSAFVGDVSEISVISGSSGVSLMYDNNEFIPTEVQSDNVGRLNSGWIFQVEPDIGSTTNSGNIVIDLGSNRSDDLFFYVTAIDDAGNVGTNDKSFNLDDWIVTDGGLAYSSQGSTFETKIFSEDPSWNGILPPFEVSASESLLYNLADISTEMWADSSSVGVPLLLTKSTRADDSNIGNYNIRDFKGTKVPDYYDTLFKAFERNREKLIIEKANIVEGVSELSTNLTRNGCPTNNYCILIAPGNLIVNKDIKTFLCNKKGVIFVGGNLTIVPNILNQNNKQDDSAGCLFVVKGDVNIPEGVDNSDGIFAYDIVNAYILANGKITIENELSKLPSSTDDLDIIDDAENVLSWVSSDSSNTPIYQELTSHTEGQASIRIHNNGTTGTQSLDPMEYSTDSLARSAYVGSGGNVFATGGTESTVGGYKIHKFTASGTLNVTRAGNVEVLVLAGGGGGGMIDYMTQQQAGWAGGGAGGHVYNSSFALTTGSKAVTRGAGGGTSATGGNSVFSGITALGGGKGDGGAGDNGGCGAGGSNGLGGGTGSQGGNGGASICSICGNATAGGGGGGGGGNGLNSRDYYGANGGIGVNYSIISAASAGIGGYVAGGGGGEKDAGSVGWNGAAGGSGIVLVRYFPYNGLFVYSESSIKQPGGSYALKVVADQTTSLNKTLTKTLSSPINLSDYTEISFYLRASRMGSNIKVGFRDSGGAVTEIIPNVTVANTYQLVTLDISGVSNLNKDAITQIIITIVNAGANNTFYIDDINGSVSGSRNDIVSTTKGVKDMSGYDYITFSAKSTEIGQQIMRFWFGLDGLDYFEDVEIKGVDQWETISVDIRGIPADDRFFNRYAFQVINLSDGQDFYFDNIRNTTGTVTIDYGNVMDGVYINGGLLSMGEDKSIIIERYLRLEERLKYPVLVVDSHSKYGAISEKVFGGSYTLQKTEVGFKP